MDRNQTNDTLAPSLATNNPSPQEVYEQMERYLKETEGLIALLRESFAKGEEQLLSLKAFDVRAPQLSPAIPTIDTASLQGEIEEVRQHIVSLEEMRDRVKADMEKVKAIGEKIAGFISQYRPGAQRT